MQDRLVLNIVWNLKKFRGFKHVLRSSSVRVLGIGFWKIEVLRKELFFGFAFHLVISFRGGNLLARHLWLSDRSGKWKRKHRTDLVNFRVNGVLTKNWYPVSAVINTYTQEQKITSLSLREGLLTHRRDTLNFNRSLPNRSQITEKMSLFPQQNVLFKFYSLSKPELLWWQFQLLQTTWVITVVAVTSEIFKPFWFAEANINKTFCCCNKSHFLREIIDETLTALRLWGRDFPSVR